MRAHCLTLVLAASALALAACGSTEDPTLPSYETLALAAPGDDLSASSALTTSQAICLGTNTDAYENLLAYIDEHNDEIKDRLDMLRLLKQATKRALKTDGEVEWTRTAGGRTLTLQAAVQSDGSVSYTATFEGPNVASYTFLSGTSDADGLSGTWTIYRIVGAHDPAINVTWTRDGNGAVTVVRDVVDASYPGVTCTNGDRRAVYTRDPVLGKATLELTTCRHELTASWDITTKDGTATIDSGSAICWDADGNSGTVCETACQ